MIKTIIIDDEPEAREGISSLIGKDKELDIVAICKNGLEAIESINKLEPDLVFLDIQMPEINGFDVLNNINKKIPYIIFATAFDQYALKAFEIHAQDYLLKPFTDERFNESVTRAKSFFKNNFEVNSNQLTSMLEAYRKENISSVGEVIVKNGTEWNRIVIKTSGKIIFIELNDIELIEAYENYVKVHVKDRFHLVRESMKSMEAKLINKHFIRIHKSYIVNMNHASELSHKYKGDYTLTLLSGRTIKVSRKFTSNLNNFL